MSVIITVDDGLARRLQLVAEDRNTSVEELAITILEDAVPTGDEEWGTRNRRRLELIRKSTRGDLTSTEQAELDHLQSWLDEKFEAFDGGLLDQLDEMKQGATSG